MNFTARTSTTSEPFEDRLAQACRDLQAGRPVILMDDFDRENEADLILAAERISVAEMSRLIRDCSGIVCLCLPEAHLAQLALPQMVADNNSQFGTAFTISIEAKHGVTTGVSAADRVTTIRAAIAPGAQPDDLARPGHVFPLRAQTGGLMSRRGHTEGAVDLVRLAGLQPAAVLCELMKPDGAMMRGADIEAYAQEHALVVLSIDELVQYLQVQKSDLIAKGRTDECLHGKSTLFVEALKPLSNDRCVATSDSDRYQAT